MRYPQAIEVDGRRFPINTSYQTAIRCYEIVQDEAVTDAERGAIVMLLLLGDIPQDLSVDGMKRLQELLVKYLQCGKEPEQIREMDEILTEREPDMDYTYDMGLIIASFISDYKIDLSEPENETMHWWKFIDLLNGLSPKSALNRVREIRNKDLGDYKDNPKAMEELIQAKRLVALPEKITESEQEALDEFDRLLRGEVKEND
jgi:rorf198 protein